MPRFLALAALLLPALAHAQSVPPAKVRASIGRVYGAGAAVDTLRPGGAIVFRVTRGDSLLGWAQVREVIGKDQPITFLVATDSAGRLRDVDILVYREPYGGEVAYPAWRKQFRGKGSDDPIAVGRDIRNISGATISTHAVTAGVRQALADFATWRREGFLR